jgi:hypothetical protein
MKILACASDPGGARNVAPVMLEALKQNIEIVVLSSKQTKNIFLNYGINNRNIQSYTNKKIAEILLKEGPDVILCGATRFGYKLPELYIIDLGKNNNIPSAVVFDEWFYYARRFWNENKELKHLPNIIFCQDKLALTEACSEGVPKKLLQITGSPAYSEIYYSKRKLFLNKKPNKKINILFISEAHSEAYGSKIGDKGPHGVFQGYTEITVRETIARVINLLDKKVNLKEKLHPNQKLKLLKPINLLGGSNWHICAINSNLDELLLEADIVIGMRSAVLLEAWLLGKKVISFQPNLLVENKCTVSRRGFVKHIKTENVLFKELRKILEEYKNDSGNKSTPPKFCDKNASINILNNLKEIQSNYE